MEVHLCTTAVIAIGKLPIQTEGIHRKTGLIWSRWYKSLNFHIKSIQPAKSGRELLLLGLSSPG